MALDYSIAAVFKGIDNVSKPLRQINKSVKKYDHLIERSNKHTKKLGASLRRTMLSTAGGFIGAQVAISAFKSALVGTVVEGAKLEDTLMRASLNFTPAAKMNGKVYKALSKTAKDYGASTLFTAGQVAGALNSLGKAGFKTEQAIKSIPIILDFATSANIGLAEATNMSANALSAFGKEVKDPVERMRNMAKVMDVINASAKGANMSVDNMYQAIVNVGATSVAAGQSMETTSAMLMGLTKGGIVGAEAGTKLRAAYNDLLKVKNIKDKLLQGMGISILDKKGDVRNMIDIFADLQKAIKKTGGSGEQYKKISQIFGQRAITVAALMAKENNIEYVRAAERMLRSSKGVTHKMVKEINKDLVSRFKFMTSALDEVRLRVFDKFEPYLIAFLDKAKNFFTYLTTAEKGALSPLEKYMRLGKDLLYTAVSLYTINKGWLLIKKTMLGIMIVKKAWIMLTKGQIGVQRILNMVMMGNPLVAILKGIFVVVTLLMAIFPNFTDTIINAFLNPIKAINYLWGMLKKFLVFLGILKASNPEVKVKKKIEETYEINAQNQKLPAFGQANLSPVKLKTPSLITMPKGQTALNAKDTNNQKFSGTLGISFTNAPENMRASMVSKGPLRISLGSVSN